MGNVAHRMMAFEFIAHDRAGLKLANVTDGGYCTWLGTAEQHGHGDYLEAHFAEHGRFPDEEEDNDEEV